MAAPAVLRVLEREAHVFRRLWKGSIGAYFVNPLLFLTAMGVGLGGLVEEQSGDVGGVSYLVFVVPGLLAANAMQAAAGDSLWHVMAGLKWVGSYKAIVATPVGPAEVFGGVIAWTTIRSGIASAAFLTVAAVAGAVPATTGLLAVPAAMLCAAAFAAPLTAFSATQDTDAAFSVIMRLGIVPLFLFSGTFFPVGQLPDWLRAAVALSPLWHGVELCRAATTGDLGPAPAVVAHVAVLALITAIGWRWGTRIFARRLTP